MDDASLHPKSPEEAPPKAESAPSPLAYEETPVIESPPPATPPAPSTPPHGGSFLKTIGTIILFGVLFFVGIVLSSFLRQFLPSGIGLPGIVNKPSEEEQVDLVPTEPVTPPGAQRTGITAWKTYQVVSGLTRQLVGVSFQLPPDVLSPICDGANCASQGTYLPGGTRFTVAARGTGQVLADYRGTQISDVAGRVFTTRATTVAGRSATEFTGTFAGRTVSGYAFSQMRGYMIDLDSTSSIEVNHFTPSGISADFTADDALFEKIVATFVFSGSAGGEKGAVLTTPTPVLTPYPTATGSGY